QEVCVALKKARQQYQQRCEDLDRVWGFRTADDTAGNKTLDKRRKIVAHVRKLICQGDTVLKEIPEPLLTFDLYGDFINVGKAILHSKEAPVDTAGVTEDIVNSLRSLLEKLPLHCYSTLQHITAHLHRVSQHFEVNRMSSGNLGIVFGPTLLRPLESLDMSMEAVVESSYQALLVEFLITQYDRVFGPRTLRAGTPPPLAPTAPLPETPPRPACDPAAPDSLGADPELGASCIDWPKSLE
ncbi:hypothetical protein CRUP_009876, partial [Coryphaenoides rupestris]